MSTTELTPTAVVELNRIASAVSNQPRALGIALGIALATILPLPDDETGTSTYLAKHQQVVFTILSIINDHRPLDYHLATKVTMQYYLYRSQFSKMSFIPVDIFGIQEFFDPAMIEEIKTHAYVIQLQQSSSITLVDIVKHMVFEDN